MEVTFIDKKLEKIAANAQALTKKFGRLRASKFKDRLEQLTFASNLEEVRYQPGNFHELSNNRKGQWACDLDQPYRLVFTPHEDPIPINKYGQYIWMEIIGVAIKEISNYHKEK